MECKIEKEGLIIIDQWHSFDPGIKQQEEEKVINYCLLKFELAMLLEGENGYGHTSCYWIIWFGN